MEVVGRKFRGIDPANTTTCTPLAQPELKVELEMVAFRRKGATERRLQVQV
jgi:2-iminobutanoate/2-iminopropanoate deaminase